MHQQRLLPGHPISFLHLWRMGPKEQEPRCRTLGVAEALTSGALFIPATGEGEGRETKGDKRIFCLPEQAR